MHEIIIHVSTKWRALETMVRIYTPQPGAIAIREGCSWIIPSSLLMLGWLVGHPQECPAALCGGEAALGPIGLLVP